MKKVTLVAGALLVFALLSGCAVTVHNHDRGYSPSHRDTAIVIWGEYYGCGADTIRYLERSGYEDEDIFVFLSISYWSHVDVKLVVEQYRVRQNFFAVATFYRIDPFLFYVDIDRRTHLGPPYGRAYGYYYKRSRNFTLTDVECRDLVGLRIFVEYYRYDVVTVVKLREQSKNNIVLMTERYQDCGRGENVRGRRVVRVDRPWEVKEREERARGQKRGDDERAREDHSRNRDREREDESRGQKRDDEGRARGRDRDDKREERDNDERGRKRDEKRDRDDDKRGADRDRGDKDEDDTDGEDADEQADEDKRDGDDERGSDDKRADDDKKDKKDKKKK